MMILINKSLSRCTNYSEKWVYLDKGPSRAVQRKSASEVGGDETSQYLKNWVSLDTFTISTEIHCIYRYYFTKITLTFD